MGKQKHQPQGRAWAAEGSEQEENGGQDDNAATQLCGICGEDFEPANETEGYIVVKCNTCGTAALHRECAITFLEARASEKSNSHAVTKYKVKCRKRPQEIFSLGMPCPNGAYTLRANYSTSGNTHHLAMVGSVRYKNSRALTGACSGFTTDAEVVKIAKAPAPAPPPPQASAPDPNKKKPTPAAAPAPAPQPKRGAGVRVVGQAHAPWTAVGGGGAHKPAVGAGRGAGAAARIFGGGGKGPGPGGGGGGSIPGMEKPAASGLPFPPAKRPLELQLCDNWEDMGECFHYNCPRAHGAEQLRERERAWAARQEAEKREAARRQAQAEAEARRRREEEQVEAARRASLASTRAQAPARPPPPAGLRLTDGCLALLRTHKKGQCTAQLLEMDFTFDRAMAATAAAGGDAARAVQMLLDGSPLTGEAPVDVGREAAELASVALAVGASPAAVELLLHERGGNWQAAAEVLRAQGGAGSGSAVSDHTAASLAPSEPDTPSLPGAAPAWAADASSAAPSAPSPCAQSPRASSAALAPLPCALAPSPEPGVYSLADFSADAPAEPQAAWPTEPAAQAGGAPFGSPLAAAAPQGYSDGYAAGLAAGLAGASHASAGATASPSPTPPTASASKDPWAKLQAQALAAAAAAGYGGYGTSQPAAAQQAEPAVAAAPQPPAQEEDEVEALLGLMGIS